MASNNNAAAADAAPPNPKQQLCASCDRCRSRKTKCDGGRPCGNCITRYKKANKVESVEGLDLSCFDCVYSPAKRRGPIPGRSGQARAAASRGGGLPQLPNPVVNNQFFPGQAPSPMGQALNDGMFQLGLDGGGVGIGQQQPQLSNVNAMGNNANLVQGNNTNFSSDDLKQMLALQQQLLVQQQQMQAQQQQQGMLAQLASMTGVGGGGMNANSGLHQMANAANTNPTNVGGMTMIGTGSNNLSNGGFSNSNDNGTAVNVADGLFNAGANNNFQNSFQAQHQPQQQFFQDQLQQQQPQASMCMSNNQIGIENNDRSAKRVHTTEATNPSRRTTSTNGLPNSIAVHLPLLELNNPDGSLLRSYYELSSNDLLNLPPIPTDEEYCNRLNEAGGHYISTMLPTYDQSALHAARFSELALGALANNQVPLALELSNASVMCLRNCVEEPSHKSCMYDVARAYLLHGIFRSFRGDMVRYFKYRRVCMTHILQLSTEPHVEALLAAISFHDAWAYLLHNASEESLPDIDGSLPRLGNDYIMNTPKTANEIKDKYGCCIKPSSVATDPINQMWMQGSPPVFLNNEAHPVSRSLDAFACAVRSCCDQANSQFEEMAKASGMAPPGAQNGGQTITPTTSAVMANENELCSRNIVLSAKTLLDQHWGTSNAKIVKKHGLTMVAAAMNAFLENDEMNGEGGNSGATGGSGGGFSDGQIKNLLTACDIIIQHPLLLHSPGPLYHMSTNAAIMLCHLLNGIHSNCGNKMNGSSPSPSNNGDGSPDSKAEGILFDEVLDTFMAMRKVLNIHRKSLPVKLRCHGIPRPGNVGPLKKHTSAEPESTFIDLGETLMCICRGCQGFVLMGCSPCVAAERAMGAAQRTSEDAEIQPQWNGADNDFERQIGTMDDLNLDDDALLDVLSRIVQN